MILLQRICLQLLFVLLRLCCLHNLSIFPPFVPLPLSPDQKVNNWILPALTTSCIPNSTTLYINNYSPAKTLIQQNSLWMTIYIYIYITWKNKIFRWCIYSYKNNLPHLIFCFLLNHCREEENLVFWFGAQFNSTLNFTQSGWLILFSPDLHFWLAKRVSGQTQSLRLETATRTDVPLVVPA